MDKYISREVALQKLAKAKKSGDDSSFDQHHQSEISLDADISREEQNPFNLDPRSPKDNDDSMRGEPEQDAEARKLMKEAIFLVDPMAKIFI